MKCFVIILILFSFKVQAKSPEVLKCLGEEEKVLHLRKISGPIYELNQRLIAEMVQIPNATLTESAFKVICADKSSVSWNLLRLSLMEGKKIFAFPSQLSGGQRQITEGMIEEYISGSKEILLNLISQIQALSPTPTCLKEEIPLLEKFFIDIKYLEDEVDMKRLFEGREMKIFGALKSYPEFFKKCQERLKKKAKSGSTSSRR